VGVNEGIVTLLGQVNRGEERVHAAELAAQTRGVRAVVNRLEVDPSWAPRSDLVSAVRQSLLELSGDEFTAVTVTVDGSDVHLSGTVPHARGKEMAERAAWYVSGVTGVDNAIRVRPDATRTDQELTEDVERSLRSDPYVGGALIRVSVKEGTVRLSGAVQSMFERRRARERALLVGVLEVDDSGLRVLPESVRSGGYARPRSDDREMTAAIRDAFRADPRIPERGVDFHVTYGVVTLTGAVHTYAQKLAASEDARNALGTWAVLNQLEVEPEGSVLPKGLAQQVMARLRGHPSVTVDGIRVAADAGTITLEGAVSSIFERTAAEHAVAAVPGVTDIVNRLEIRPVHELRRSDGEIHDDIERALWWDPRLGSARIEVVVDNGVVTLRGEVPNPEVYDAVLEDAYRAAPLRVLDELWQRQPARFLYSK